VRDIFLFRVERDEETGDVTTLNDACFGNLLFYASYASILFGMQYYLTCYYILSRWRARHIIFSASCGKKRGRAEPAGGLDARERHLCDAHYFAFWQRLRLLALKNCCGGLSCGGRAIP